MVNPAKTQVDDEPVSTDCEQAYGEVMAGDEVTLKRVMAAPPSVADDIPMADYLGLPGPYLSKILQALAQDGLLHSVRGPKGGYRLARPGHRITVRQVAAALVEACKYIPGLTPVQLDRED